jgi:hypothetical protein
MALPVAARMKPMLELQFSRGWLIDFAPLSRSGRRRTAALVEFKIRGQHIDVVELRTSESGRLLEQPSDFPFSVLEVRSIHDDDT